MGMINFAYLASHEIAQTARFFAVLQGFLLDFLEKKSKLVRDKKGVSYEK